MLAMRAAMVGNVPPVVQSSFINSLNDFTALSTLSTMPSGGSISRSGNAMLYDSTGKLTYAPNNLLLQSNTFSNASWSKLNSVVTGSSGTSPDGTNNAFKFAGQSTLTNWRLQQTATLSNTVSYVYSVYAKKAEYDALKVTRINANVTSITHTFNLTNGTASGGGTIVSVGNDWYRCSGLVSCSADGSSGVIFTVDTTDAGNGTSGILVYGAQLEAVTYQTTPSTYVATTSAAYYGPRFDYEPSTLAANGLLIEGTRTNLLNFSQSFATTGGSQNNWADTNITRNSTNNTSPDGTGNALRVTASAANGTIISSAAIGTSAQRVLSVWLRRVTGTGNIQYTLDNGTNWTTQSITSTWTRYRFTATTADQQVGFRIVTSNDAIEIWGVQLEAGAFSTSYIPTTTATVARAAETFAITGYSSNLIEAYYTDEATGNAYSANYNAGTAPSTSFGWTTSLRPYTNAYAGDITTPSWIDNSGTTGNRMVTDSTGALTWAPANMLLRSQDFSATWTLTNATQTAGQTDPNSGTNATTLTSSAANGTVKQAVTTLAITYIYSVWLKRKTGTGNIDITADGTTWVTQTITSSWARYSVAQTGVAGTSNPGIRIVTSGDAVDTYGAQLEAVTYQTSPRAYIPTTSAAVYQPRFDYDASTVPATPKGMLIEESRANICLRSQQFATSWATIAASVTEDQIVAPDNTQTADLITATSTGTSGYVRQVLTGSATTTYTVSVFAKSGTSNILNISPFDGTNGSRYWFNLNTGALGSTAIIGTGFTDVSASIVGAGNGWYRCIMSFKTLSLTTLNIFISECDADASLAITSGKTIYLWGAQLEAGSFATSYIPTTSASVTRVADVVKLSGSALTTAGAATGSVALQTTRLLSNTPTNYLLYENSGRRHIYYVNNTNNVSSYASSTALSATIGNSGTWTGSQVRSCFAWDGTGRSIVANGGTVASDAVAFGTGSTATFGPASGWFASIALYNQRLPDAILKQKSQPGAAY